jgi:large subunit ribosomal protein L25
MFHASLPETVSCVFGGNVSALKPGLAEWLNVRRYTFETMADITLRAQLRTLTGKKVGALRRAGIIPGNIYGRGLESIAIQMDVRSFRDTLAKAGTTTVVDLHVSAGVDHEDANKHPVLIEHVATHPSTGKVLHVDLHQVDLSRPIHAPVPIVLEGESGAVKNEGGVLMHSLDAVEVEALPRELPQEFVVDISSLGAIDDQITVGDLPLEPGVTLLTDPETIVVRVVASKLEQEVAAEEAETAAAAEEEAAEAAEEAGEAEGESADEETSEGESA